MEESIYQAVASLVVPMHMHVCIHTRACNACTCLLWQHGLHDFRESGLEVRVQIQNNMTGSVSAGAHSVTALIHTHRCGRLYRARSPLIPVGSALKTAPTTEIAGINMHFSHPSKVFLPRDVLLLVIIIIIVFSCPEHIHGRHTCTGGVLGLYLHNIHFGRHPPTLSST